MEPSEPPDESVVNGFVFTPMTEADARDILAWRYTGPYVIYNAPDAADGGMDESLREFLDTRSPYFAVCEQGRDGDPIAFFAFGSAGEVGGEASTPHLLRADGSLTIGLGLRPDLTGQGRGLALVQAGLDLARKRYAPTAFRLHVFAWNKRAIRVYERAGFVAVGETRIVAPEGERVFIEMTRSV